MAEKRYYWLKLKENYFDSPKIKKLRKIAGGDTYTIIYLKLQLLSIKNNGIIEYEKIEPTFQEELALKLDEDVENISVTLSYLQSQGLVDVNENSDFFLIEASNNIGSESESAERVRLFRERKNQKVLQEPKSNAVRQRQFRAKEICKQSQHIPMIEDYINNKRYNGNYYLVFKRDEMKCAICGETENLCVHHIDGYDENKPQNSNENKMITLCRECHSKVHSQSIDISKLKLESIGYFDECNESNEMCNDSVTEVKQISISNSNSNSTSNSNSNSNNKDKKDSEIEQEFEEVWKLYPRKEDKKKAFLAYKTARKKASFDEIKKGVETYSNHIRVSNTDKRYIKLGATYFNGECWANKYEQAAPQEELIKGKYTRAQVEEFAKQLNISYEKALKCCGGE